MELHGNAASHQSLPEKTLQQAIVSTQVGLLHFKGAGHHSLCCAIVYCAEHVIARQVVDGFFVKRVQDVKESAAYLAIMSRQLTKLYQVISSLPEAGPEIFSPRASCVVFFIYHRTERWSAAPESWRATRLGRRTGRASLPARLFRLPSLITVPSKTR